LNGRVHRGAQCLEHLTGQPAELWTARPLVGATAESLVVEYSLAGDARRTVVGKFYADETSGRHAFETMRALRSALDATAGSLALGVPEPIHWDPANRLLVQARAPGRPLSGPEAGPASRESFVLIGQALAVLHGLDVGAGPARTLEDHVRELIRPRPRELAASHPEYRALVERTLADLSRVPAPAEHTPLHRDFQLRQLFRHDGRVWVVDWDDFASGDPAFDVAYFLVYLETHLSAEVLKPSEAGFLEGYLARRPASVLERVPDHRRFNYLRRACRRFRLRDERWEERMREMLNRLESMTP
jgi:aminoglycoside phosphotransferase (APT) family kinase protein